MTEHNTRRSGVERRAQIISDILSPILVPTIAMTLAMWVTSLRVLPERSRLIATLIIFAVTGIIPLVAIIILQRLGLVSDNSISIRSQRPLPMTITMLCYLGAGLLLRSMHAPLWLQCFFYGAGIAAGISVVITWFWKISAHTLAMGGLVGMLLWFAVEGLADVNAMAILSIGIVVAGGVGTCRLILNRHTLGQVIAGLLLGFCCTFGTTWLICR